MRPQDAVIQRLGADGSLVGIRRTEPEGWVYADRYPHGAELDEDGDVTLDGAPVRPDRIYIISPEGGVADVTGPVEYEETRRLEAAADPSATWDGPARVTNDYGGKEYC